jgi:hypothetical protein
MATDPEQIIWSLSLPGGSRGRAEGECGGARGLAASAFPTVDPPRRPVRDAITAEATRRIGTTYELTDANALGVNEHVSSHAGPPRSGMDTGIMDDTRDAHGVVHARLLDLRCPNHRTPSLSVWFLRHQSPGRHFARSVPALGI